MDIYSQEFKQRIYDLMTDRLCVDVKYVKNEFEKDSICTKKYQEIYDANVRLCRRLNVKEDSDIECIINNFLEITELLSIKMYDYGLVFVQLDKGVKQ